jgi:hypothetical protein
VPIAVIRWSISSRHGKRADGVALWHGDDLEDGAPEAKLLGVYASESAARDRISRSASVAGFAEHPGDFHIARYQIDKDEWTEGYVEVE